VNALVQKLSNSTLQNASLTREVATSVEELNARTKFLTGLIVYLKVKHGIFLISSTQSGNSSKMFLFVETLVNWSY